MIEWLLSTVPLLKGVHIAAISIWCAGLIVLPLMLTRHHPAVSSEDHRLIRNATHLTYTLCVTPAAVIAVIAGAWLIFLREAYMPWFYAKLVFVALLVAAHARVGHLVHMIAEKPGRRSAPWPYLPVASVLVPVVAILFLVLAKPTFDWISFPEWLLEPRDGQLLFDVPSR
ncbi:hypothetical protein FF098_000620 [Parvularcula flava]|uniref:Protoporphyrinogen IX oxidase n=1 Tax=Aquisalinus luteolus TaxID=1566827 RepID=A0A8J3A3U5_9PROT|nr:CopD family protein [Aquisalinus luteolus]NHK26404.1 hypothetical protein [Aquisalinus luteolus]GGH92235.1 membrane protein [Aquisalinus luteolus]